MRRTTRSEQLRMLREARRRGLFAASVFRAAAEEQQKAKRKRRRPR